MLFKGPFPPSGAFLCLVKVFNFGGLGAWENVGLALQSWAESSLCFSASVAFAPGGDP